MRQYERYIPHGVDRSLYSDGAHATESRAPFYLFKQALDLDTEKPQLLSAHRGFSVTLIKLKELTRPKEDLGEEV